jgi:FtsP/CotA-like multicopper oxidase with cupredoxin domain
VLVALLPALDLGCGGGSGGPDGNAAGDGGADAGDGGEGTDDAPGGSACVTLATGECVEETFENPPVLEPDERGVHWLELQATEVELGGQRHCVRAYNGRFVAPTIETPYTAETARQVRVNLANGMLGHDYRSLEGQACTCKDPNGATCVPAHIHDKCATNTADSCECRSADGELCEHMFDFNVTNLHAHGSHVRPDWARGGESCVPATRDGLMFGCRECGDDACDGLSDDTCYHADNVLNSVHPGTGAQYRWDIDEDGPHHTGLQWYHPHIHGTTAIQVASGAAGAWIVRGPLDALPNVAEARERVMIFSTAPISGEDGFVPLEEGEVCTDSTLTFNNFATLGSVNALQTNLINGQVRPRMITPPGQVERWRILHAGFLDEVFLGLFRGNDSDCSSFSTAEEDTISLRQIGRDGLILPQVFAHSNVFMSPGYRVEAILGGADELRDGDTYCLVAARFLQVDEDGKFGPFGAQPMSPPTAPSPEDLLARFETDGSVVMVLNVSSGAGAPTTTELPDFDAIAALAPSLTLQGKDALARCAEAAAVTDPALLDQAAVLQVGYFTNTVDDPDPCDCQAYNVNCRNFEYTDRSIYPFDRDLALGEVEHWRVQASLDGHPFHIHINPFVVCPSDNPFDPIPFPHWRDTYLVNVDRRIDLLSENRAFTGPFVFHCHKLTHEDHGMMELIRVCDPLSDATCGTHHWSACAEDDVQCLKARAATECGLAAQTPAELAACQAALSGPDGLCGPNGCASNDDCALTHACADFVCVPAVCTPPCGPGAQCVHGACE